MMQQMFLGYGGGGLSFDSNALFAFSGDNGSTDETGNGYSLVHDPGNSSTQKKWSSYTNSFYLAGSGYTRVETPTFNNTGEWSIEFWVYPTQWSGKYVLTSGTQSQTSGPAINIQSDHIRTYGSWTGTRVDYSINTSTLLNQWNFWQIYKNGSTTRYVLNGTQITSCDNSNTGPINHLVFGNKESSPAENFPITGYFQDIVVYQGGTSRGQVSVPTTPFGL